MNGLEVIKEAATVEEAFQLACDELNVSEEAAEFEVLEYPEKHMLGKNKPAKVRVWIPEMEDDETMLDQDMGLDEEDVLEDGQYADSDDEEPEDDSSFVLDEEEMDEEDGQQASPAPEAGTLSEEEFDRIADTAIEVLRSILTHFDADDAGIDEYEGNEGEVLLDVVGDNLAVLIGRHGRTLDALQYAVTSATNKRLGFRYPVVIDIEGYKYRRRQKLESMARSAASKVYKFKRDVKLHSMNPYERRIVHIALRDDRRVTTISEGEEPNRCVVIKLREK